MIDFNEYIKTPNLSTANLHLAKFYFVRGQHAAALSFFLRGADRAGSRNLHYMCMLGVAQCLLKVGSRTRSAEHALLTCIDIDTRRYEAYYLLAKLYEQEQKWQLSYTMATQARFAWDSYEQSKDITADLYGAAGIKFQQAVAAWWVGKVDQSRKLMYEVYASGDLMHKNAALKNLRSIGYPRKVNNVDNSRVEAFFHSNLIREGNYSQTMQDIFVLSALKTKTEGTYLEFGSADPEYCNNTYLLETRLSWTGQSFDILPEHVAKFNLVRSNPCYLVNILEQDFELPKEVDYLQVDCEPPNVSLEILKKVLQSTKANVITFEHDAHTGALGEQVREESRRLLERKGYELIVPNVCFEPGSPYEDWWIHSSVSHKMPFSHEDMIMAQDYFYTPR